MSVYIIFWPKSTIEAKASIKKKSPVKIIITVHSKILYFFSKIMEGFEHKVSVLNIRQINEKLI